MDLIKVKNQWILSFSSVVNVFICICGWMGLRYLENKSQNDIDQSRQDNFFPEDRERVRIEIDRRLNIEENNIMAVVVVLNFVFIITAIFLQI